MEKLLQTANVTVFDQLAKKVIPWRQAAAVKEINMPFSKTSEEVSEFLVAAMQEVISDQSVKADIEKRIKSGSGFDHKCNSGCSHSHSSKSVVDELIADSMSSESLSLLAHSVIAKATMTYQNVLAKGKQAGDTSMDSATDAFIRRRIFIETIVRELVLDVQSKFKKIFSSNARDGFLFALAPSDRKFDSIPSSAMAQLMTVGYCVINNQLVANSERINDLLHELKRLSKLFLFDAVPGRTDKVYWLNSANPPAMEKHRMKSLLDLCGTLCEIPYELNQKNKQLMVQVVQFFQISEFDPNSSYQGFHSDGHASGRKITVIVPLVDSTDSVVAVSIKNGPEIRASRTHAPVIFLNSNTVEYECPESSFHRYHVSAFLTGPLS